MTDICIVFITFPDLASAETVAKISIQRGAAACVNIVQGVHSVYKWQGKIEKSPEVFAIVKTAAAELNALEAIVAEFHPYKIFEFVAISADKVNEPYSIWVKGCLEKPEK